MGISKLNGSWAAVIHLCKINKIEPLTAFNLLEAHVDKEFYGTSEKHSFWIAALSEDRATSKKETPYKTQDYIVKKYCPLVDERFYGKTTKNISWGVKNEKVISKGKHAVKYRDTSITNIHNLRQKIRGKHLRSKKKKSWKEFYLKIWPQIKKSQEFSDIIKSLKFK